ncbi:MAG: hypothetical protein LBR30_05705 [Clostridioides sp.]|jgi:hypothetical protein|nr:hypothetical protein [Clostridioides sp.]
MNKKLLTGILASSVLLSTSNVFATDLTTAQNKDVEVSYTVESSYTVTIPSAYEISTLTGKSDAQKVTLSAYPKVDPSTPYLHITVTSKPDDNTESGGDEWKLVRSSGTDGVDYQLGTTDAGKDLSDGEEIVFTADGTKSTATEQDTYANIDNFGDAKNGFKYATEYTDTLTFTLTLSNSFS